MFGNNSFGNASFGSTTFGTGFGTTPTLGAFGSPAQAATQPSGPVGTTIRFVPLNGTDTVQKTGTGAGGPSQITTRHQNISAMKEYETKSVDELRLEDYTAGRKVGQPQTAFNSTPFSSMQPSTSQQSTSIFGANTQPTSNLFASQPQNQSTNIFGQPKTGFELNSASNIFSSSLNKPNTTAGTSPFNLGTQFNTNTSTTGAQSGFPLFNNNAQTNTTPFGTSTVNSPFKTNMFAAPTSNTGSIFNTSTSNNTSGFLNTNQTNTATQPQPFGSNTSIFGSTANNSNSFSSGNLFNTQPKTGFELNNTSGTGIFNTLNKPTTTTSNASPFQIGTPFNSNTSTGGGLSLFNNNAQANTTPFGTSNTTLNKPTTTVASSPFNIGVQANTSTSTAGGQTGFPLFNNNAQTNTTPFGTSAVNSPFKTNMFAAPASNTGSFFNTPTSNATSGFLNTNQTNTATQPQPFGTGTSIFGTSTNNTNSFPSSNLFNTQPKTGFELNTTSSGGIFNTLNKPANTTTNASPFQIGAPAGGMSLFNNTIQTNSTPFPTNNPTNDIQQSTQSPDLLLNRLKTLPYGETSLYINDAASSSSGLGSLKFTTDPKTINQYKMNAKTNVKLNKPTSTEKTRTNSVLFDGLDDASDDLRCAIDVFVPKKNIKKLDLKPTSHLSEGDADHVLESPPFERTRSNIAARLLRDNTLESEPATPTRHVRYADNTFPGDRSDTNTTVGSNLPDHSTSVSDLSSYPNASANRSNTSAQSSHNTSLISNRSVGSASKSGVINTRLDYKIKPTIDEIERRYNSDNGTCKIDSLLIERSNYGSILFESPLDVKGLNLDEIVHIRRKEVVVYPDDDNKPPVGHGLNQPAIVTLHQVWPTDKSNNEVIKDIDRLNSMRYPEKVESATVEKGARFIEYRPETGSWVFAVKHFSKYGITDDDEEPVPKMISTVNNQVQQALSQNQLSSHNIQQSKGTPESGLLLDCLKASTNQYKMSAKINVKLNKTPNHDKPKTNSILLDSFEDNSNYSMRNAIDELSDDEENNGKKNDCKRSLTVHGTKRLALQNASSYVSSPAYDRPLVVGAIVPEQQRVQKIKLKPDLYAAQNKLIRDIMSVCVSGSPKVRFFNGSRRFSCIQGDTVFIHDLKLVPTDPEGGLTEDLKMRFETFLEHNSIVTSLNMNPTLAPYIETFDFISNASCHDLLHALYGNLTSKKPYEKQDERLTRLVNWLASANRMLPAPTNLYQLIIYHMSCDRYDLASTVAIENDHPRLALLVATMDPKRDMKIFEQLSSWRLSTADQYIDHELLKIYILLSGLTEWKLSNDKTVYCLKGLSWTQQLCLLALRPTSNEYGFHRLPLYIRRLDTDTNDVEYHIIARNSAANILSAAKTFVEEWFLLESLKSFHVINSESECINSDIIHCNLASQLGPIDLRWACFVALHIINNEVRNQVLVRCLEQNHGQLDDIVQDSSKSAQQLTVKSWLVEKLKVPLEFIENSKALAKSN